jgi:hypothetical protein
MVMCEEMKSTPVPLTARQLAKFGLMLMIGVSVSACGTGSEKWKEVVQLSDGHNIIVDREMTREAGGDELASNHSGSKPKAYYIRFEYPDGSGKSIEWHSTKIDSQTWPEVPLILDMESGQPVVFSIIGISSACEIYSKYVYRNGTWIEEPLPEQFEQHTTNLLFGTQKDLPELVNLEEKRKRNSGVGYRKALKQVGPSLKVCG